eukprot:TRINITY_DN17450_c0_g1_i1.p1 TRINITY_DN17450_c0_g1~~TRINITY_DN17450_c0_g1_i1.p1  ORF type:complete len:240 (-),score=51.40 TRINITY_DN17450_c0_g1_i1:23-742(-)
MSADEVDAPLLELQRLLGDVKKRINLNLLARNYYDVWPDSREKAEQLALLTKQLPELEAEKQYLMERIHMLSQAPITELSPSVGIWRPKIGVVSSTAIPTQNQNQYTLPLLLSPPPPTPEVKQVPSPSQADAPPASSSSSASSLSSSSTGTTADAMEQLQQIISMSELEFLERLRVHIVAPEASSESTRKLVLLREEFLQDCVAYGDEYAKMFCFMSLQCGVALTTEQKQALKAMNLNP